MSCRKEGLGLLEPELHVKHPLAPVPYLAAVIPELHLCCLLRRHVELLNRAFLHHFPVLKELPNEPVCGKVTEEVLVVHGDDSLLKVSRGCPYRLVDVSHLVCVRVEAAVRADQTVVAEILVLVHVVAVKVAGISVDILPAAILPVVGLVNKVPDEAALV